MKRKLLSRCLVLVLYFIAAGLSFAKAQSTDPKSNVMMQGFWWNSYLDPTVSSEGGLYNFLKARSGQLQAAGLDVIWTPPPSDGAGMAYFPQQLNLFSNAHGSEAQLRAYLSAVKAKGMHGMADVIANHRNGTTAWADFTNPTWGCEVIVQNDEVAGVAGQIQPCSGVNDEGEGFAGVRDMNHQSATVQNGYKSYLASLKGLGFDSWRWDFTKGYPGKYVGEYNSSSAPYFSVGEYFDANISLLTNWVTASGNKLSGTTTKSATFDFSTYYTLADAINNNNWAGLNSSGHMPGLAGTFGYAEFAVTFAGNHDVSSITGTDKVLQANAYILTHPGIPMVFLPHWLSAKQKINELIAVRKQNGISAFSSITINQSATFYAAYIDNKVAVKIGAGTWSPSGTGWILNTSGNNYAVWSKVNITTPPVFAEPYVSISMIGPALSGWGTDVPMTTTDGTTYKLYSQTFTAGPVKLRAANSWSTNWGDSSFPSGVGTQNGKDIPVTGGKYDVTFNIQTGAFTFGAPTVAPPNNFKKLYLQGASTNNQKVQMNTIDGYNYNLVNYTFNSGGLVVIDSAGTSTWGDTSFPYGNAKPGGASIPVIAKTFSVKYNKVSSYYEFSSADTTISIIGTAAKGWDPGDDIVMTSTDLGVNYSLDYKLDTGQLKFRQDKSWTKNWGAASFPSGTGVQDGPNIPIPDSGFYHISFNKTTGTYNFKLLKPVISSFSPASALKGATVTVKGTNLSGATAVSFGGTTAASFIALNDSTVTAIIGTGATGKVVVTTPFGVATSSTNFTYLGPTVYEFTGSGNWSTAANWKNGQIPPLVLTNGAEVIINPAGTTECVMDVIGETISSGTKVTVQTGKKIRITNKFNLLTGGTFNVL